MRTPICEFVRTYAKEEPLRFHMPGHKGEAILGVESLDITEVAGADVLYDAKGVILESQKNAASLFGSAKTLYSTEGSSLSIRAMLYLACLFAREQGRGRAKIIAGRNAHKTFMTAAALLDFDVEWLWGENFLSCKVTADEVEARLSSEKELPTALYLTSPDYLGNTVDLRAIAKVCHAHGVLLLVDNAHGAYLKFLPIDGHPMTLGADACCDSAHKTLPVLTGGGYLHLGACAPKLFFEEAEAAMSLFASTSPSYLILQSLDIANAILARGFGQAILSVLPAIDGLKQSLSAQGYSLVGDEPMKLTIAPKSYGYTGDALSQILREAGVECEFSDADFIVFMLSPALGEEQLASLGRALTELPRREAIQEMPPSVGRPVSVMTVRDAAFAPRERLPIAECLGRVLASMSISCPPAVPVAICGETLDARSLCALDYYGVRECDVVRKI